MTEISGHHHGETRLLYMLLSGVAALLLALGGAFVSHLLSNTDAAQLRIGKLEASQSASEAYRIDTERRLQRIENKLDTVLEQNEAIRKKVQ